MAKATIADTAKDILSYIQDDYLWEFREDHFQGTGLTWDEQDKCLTLVNDVISLGITGIQEADIGE